MRRINSCTNNQLKTLCQQSIELEELSLKLQNYLPEAFKTHCQIGSFMQGCLFIITKDPIWASQLRYQLPELRDRLRKEGGLYKLSSIKIAIKSEHTSIKPKKIKTRAFSPSTHKIILETAAQISYQPLKDAFKKCIENQVASNGTNPDKIAE